MEKIDKIELIRKDALVAEINRVLNSYGPNEITSGRYALINLRSFLNTLEVKEIDLEQCKSSDQIHYWTEEEIEPIISDYLRGAEHYGGMIARLRCLKPKSLEKQGKQKPAWSEEDKKYNNIVVSALYNPSMEGLYNFHKINRSDVITWFKSLKDSPL